MDGGMDDSRARENIFDKQENHPLKEMFDTKMSKVKSEKIPMRGSQDML